VGDKLYFYVSGRAGEKGTGAEGARVTGLATLRRDGFASIEAGETESMLLTRPLRFSGKHFFINVDAPAGSLRVEVLGENNEVMAQSQPCSGDKTSLRVEWKDMKDLSSLAQRTVRFRFHMKQGKLYAFWVSADESCASNGYVGAGGPGFTGPVDLPTPGNKYAASDSTGINEVLNSCAQLQTLSSFFCSCLPTTFQRKRSSMPTTTVALPIIKK
jgi:hypothetical protein